MSLTFHDLRVYKIACAQAGEIEAITKQTPRTELFRYRDQILRSSRSIVANIAEGYGRKSYPGELIKFLSYAIASSDETQAHLNLIYGSNFIPRSQFLDLSKQYKNLSVRLVNFLNVVKQEISK